MTEERWTLQDTIKSAREEIREFLEDNPDAVDDDIHTFAHETADSSVPCYTHDILQMVQDDVSLGFDEPELGPAFDGSPTPVNIIAANIYERIYNAVMDEARIFEQEREAEEENE